MSNYQLLCVSCKKKITNEQGSVIFDCPSCGKTKVVRCHHCRSIAARYTCQECKFSGPH